jgi:hypothetical protein
MNTYEKQRESAEAAKNGATISMETAHTVPVLDQILAEWAQDTKNAWSAAHDNTGIERDAEQKGKAATNAEKRDTLLMYAIRSKIKY